MLNVVPVKIAGDRVAEPRERNADVILMLDTLSEAGAAPETTLDASVRAAASLAGALSDSIDRALVSPPALVIAPKRPTPPR